MEIEKDKIYGISEFITFLNEDLKWIKAKIVGEVGEIKTGPTGHVYFTLKDEKDGAMISCIMWVSKYRLFGLTLEPGKKILAYGKPEIYAPNGRMSFICDTIELAGEGDIKKQYDDLKKKLEKEGLFATENKRSIPKYPHKIGIITSKQGAVIHDFLNNIGKFGFNIKMIDSRVEGQGAVEDLLASIRTFRKKEIDVLVIIRGGGSIESLMPFNNELLVREVVGFPVPVLVGIGHDKDVPLVALAADKSESTPTAVANLLNESWEQANLLLERAEKMILSSFGMIIKRFKMIENNFKVSLQKYTNVLSNNIKKLRNYPKEYLFNFNYAYKRIQEKLTNIEKSINLHNPERNIKLGYSILKFNGKIIKKISDLKIGDDFESMVSDGIIVSKTKEFKK